MIVTGTPQLALNSGGTANYSSGSGTSTLTFTYTVGGGREQHQLGLHLDLAPDAQRRHDRGHGANNAANLTLPTPGAAGSLAANKNIVIDTVAPTVVSYEVLFGSQSLNLIGSTRNDLPWQITGIRVVFSKPIATGDVNSLTGLSTTGFSGLGTTTLTWTVTPLTLGNFATMLLGTGADALKDAAGNPLLGGSNFAESFKVLYGDFNDDGVVSSTDMVAVYAATAAPYDVFADLNGDGVVNLNDVQIVRGRIGTELSNALS